MESWTLLTVVTLGLAYPWRAAALERYKMGHTFYGNLPGRFEGKGWDFFKRLWWLWLAVGLTPIARYVGILTSPVASAAPTKSLALSPTLVPFFPFVLLLFFFFVYGAFKATE